MRRLLSLFVVIAGILSAGYSFQRTVTIDHTKVPGTDQSDFPVLVSGTYTYLKTVANGGKVTNSSGYDVIFTSDDTCTTKLSHKTIRYTATTGEAIYWVKLSTVATASDTVFYMCYGNAAISTSQEDADAVWSNGYSGVWDFENGTTLNGDDLTSSNNDLTDGGDGATPVAGQIGGALITDESASGYMYKTGTANILLTTTFTVSGWVKPTNLTQSSKYATYYGGYNGGDPFWSLLWEYADNSIEFFAAGYTGADPRISSDLVLDANWHHVAWTYDGTVWKKYLDGSPTTISASISFSFGAMTNNMVFGGLRNGSGGIVGSVGMSFDHFAIAATTCRSGDWIATEYNNQSSPSTFYSVGDEKSLAGRRRVVIVQ